MASFLRMWQINLQIFSSSPVKYILNLLLQQGIFPENFKIAKVFPIHNKGEDILLTFY